MDNARAAHHSRFRRETAPALARDLKRTLVRTGKECGARDTSGGLAVINRAPDDTPTGLATLAVLSMTLWVGSAAAELSPQDLTTYRAGSPESSEGRSLFGTLVRAATH